MKVSLKILSACYNNKKRGTMYRVEHARILDIPELLEIAVQFWNESPSYQQRPINLAKVKTQLQTLILYLSLIHI